MAESVFYQLLEIARELDLLFVSGPLSIQPDGRVWVGLQSLDELLMTRVLNQSVLVAFVINGPMWEHVRPGAGVLDPAAAARIAQTVRSAGGKCFEGILTAEIPKAWIAGSNPVPFLGGRPIFTELGQADEGRTVMLVAGTRIP